jgi:threonine/homoserine/homoserine lactone efflux protein
VLDAVGSLLPVAVAVALSPFPVIAIVLLLAAPDGRAKGLMFSAGWLVGLGALTVILVLLAGRAVRSDDGRAIIDWLRVVAGLALLWAAWRKWQHRPRDGEEPAPAKWMAGIDHVDTKGSLRLGLLLGGVNPKNIALTGAAAGTIAELAAAGTGRWVSAVVYVALASLGVLGAVAVKVFAGAKADAVLGAVRRFMVANANVITMVVFAVLGAMVLGDGLAGLGQ